MKSRLFLMVLALLVGGVAAFGEGTFGPEYDDELDKYYEGKQKEAEVKGFQEGRPWVDPEIARLRKENEQLRGALLTKADVAFHVVEAPKTKIGDLTVLAVSIDGDMADAATVSRIASAVNSPAVLKEIRRELLRPQPLPR